MLQIPVDASPHNDTVDVNYPVSYSFTHHGSQLEKCKYTFYSTLRGEQIVSFWNNDSPAQNGDVVTSVYKDVVNLHNGMNYAWNVTQFQAVYDIYVKRSFVLHQNFIDWVYAHADLDYVAHWMEISTPEGVTITDRNQLIPVAYETTDIVAPIFNDNNTEVGCQYLEVNGERRKIIGLWESEAVEIITKSPDPDEDNRPAYTSAIIIETPFTTYPGYDEGVTRDDIPYKIFSNYLESPKFFLRARALPTVTPTITVNKDMGITCDATYTSIDGSIVMRSNWEVFTQDFETQLYSTTVCSSAAIQTLTSSGVLIDNTHIPVTINNYAGYDGKIVIVNDSCRQEIVNIIATNTANTYICVLRGELNHFPVFESTATIYNVEENVLDVSDANYKEDVDHGFAIYPQTTNYRAQLHITTQDNKQLLHTVSSAITIATSDTEIIDTVTATLVDEDESGATQRAAHISWTLKTGCDWADYIYNVYRKNPDNTITPLILGLNGALNSNFNGFYDHLVGNTNSYQYFVVMIDPSSKTLTGKMVSSEAVTPHFMGWTITSIQPSATLYDYTIYEHGASWAFVNDGEQEELKHNVNAAIYSSATPMPKIIKTKQNYITSGLSTMLGKIICPSGTFSYSYQLLEHWRKFIADNDLFLLKNPWGDVFIISITDSAEECDNILINGSRPFNIKFSYTQMKTNDKIIVL